MPEFRIDRELRLSASEEKEIKQKAQELVQQYLSKRFFVQACSVTVRTLKTGKTAFGIRAHLSKRK